MVSISEVLSLVIILIAYSLMFIAVRRVDKWKYLIIAYTFVVITALATVLEDFFLGNILNYLEHIVWAISAILFCYFANKFRKEVVI